MWPTRSVNTTKSVRRTYRCVLSHTSVARPVRRLKDSALSVFVVFIKQRHWHHSQCGHTCHRFSDRLPQPDEELPRQLLHSIEQVGSLGRVSELSPLADSVVAERRSSSAQVLSGSLKFIKDRQGSFKLAQIRYGAVREG